MARALGLANHPEAISVDSSNNVTVEGNFDVNGTQTIIDSTTVAVSDSLFKLAKDNTTADTLDAGWYGVYNDGSTRYAGIARDATDGKFIVYDGLTAEPGTTIDTGHASFNKATLNAGELQDAQGNVRALERNAITSTPHNFQSGSSGKYFPCAVNSLTINIDAADISTGDIFTFWSFPVTGNVTIAWTNMTNGVYIAGDTNNKGTSGSITLAAGGLCTVLCDTGDRMVFNGNVS